MKKSQKGFTIIEVALVLAVGALIFLVVFLAVPALQRNQRNDARKRDQSQIVEAITSYIANNPADEIKKGNYKVYEGGHGEGDSFGKYIDTLSNNTEVVQVLDAGELKGLDLSPKASSKMKQTLRRTIYVVPQTVCDEKHHDTLEGSTRQAAVIIHNETAKGFDRLCMSAN